MLKIWFIPPLGPPVAVLNPDIMVVEPGFHVAVTIAGLLVLEYL